METRCRFPLCLRAKQALFLLLHLVLRHKWSSYAVQSSIFPRARAFLPLPGSNAVKYSSDPLLLRVMQFNTLADGLAGLRDDLGSFNRATKEILSWENRRELLLQEITQYEPDIVTLQEVDHYYDFFLPELSKRGYSGLFARKPTSACLEVCKNGDGCALFVKKSKLRVISYESKTLALSIAGQDENGELIEDDKSIRAQNQVGIIAVCEICNYRPAVDNSKNVSASVVGPQDGTSSEEFAILQNGLVYEDRPPPVIISTTHLKSSKSASGERYRERGVEQILNDTEKIYRAMSNAGRTPVVLFSGDLNAMPEEIEYAPLTYKAVKSHPLGLRSVYNEDVPLSATPLSSKELYTTWKSRVKNGQESIVKRCIDYIFYTPFIPANKAKMAEKEKKRGNNVSNGKDTVEDAMNRPFSNLVGATGAVDVNVNTVVAYSSSQVVLSGLLRLTVYTFFALIPATSLISSGLDMNEKAVVLALSLFSLRVFELASEGTVFKPRVAAPFSSGRYIGMSEEKLAEKLYAQKLIRASVGALSSYFKPKARNTEIDGRPGLQAVAALDLFGEEEVGPELMPSKSYPSDHVALVSDLQLLW